MGVFEHFPYANFHELNISWILDKIKELEDVIGSQIVDIVARAGVAENAQAISNLTETVETNATTAHNEAAAASQAAATADSKAVTAQTTATSAGTAASAAQSTADNAIAQLANKANNGIPLANYLYISEKHSAGTSTTVAASPVSGSNRYVAIVMVEENRGESAIYGVTYRQNDASHNKITLIMGNTVNVALDNASGTISIPLQDWSKAVILSTAQFE